MKMKPLSPSLHQGLFSSLFKIFSLKVKAIWIEVGYFTILSLLGFLALSVSKPKTLPSFRPQYLDVFFTSVSATTVSSMSTVEMEVFSNTQLIFMTILMFLGGEAFVSFLRLQLIKSNVDKKERTLQNKIDSNISNSIPNNLHHLELEKVTPHQLGEGNIDVSIKLEHEDDGEAFIKLKCRRFLSYVIFGYILVVVLLGSSFVSIYISVIPSSKQILKKKGLNLHTFSLFTTVSTFTNCGFVPTTENMMIFKKNSGLLLILIPQILLGNTLYPPCLRLTIWFFWKVTKREEFVYMLKDSKKIGYSQLLPSYETISLAFTVTGLIFVQLVVFCSLEWYSEATSDLSAYEKMVGSLFEVVNARHTGESIFDISNLSSAILVMFIFMMYLSPYTSFLPFDTGHETTEIMNRRKGRSLVEYISLSQLSYLVVFTILICITERHKMKNDPLNFNVLNIVLEVVSAYGNVGFSMGYSCARQVIPHVHCKDAMYGFVGKWSNLGKFILIIVMFFGRLKMYSINGGKAWKQI